MVKKDTYSVPISVIWYERFLECSRTYRTDDFVDSVWRFYYSLVNIGKNELAIRDIVQKYYDTVWKPTFMARVNYECEQEFIGASNNSTRDLIYYQNEKDMIVQLFQFITQTIQDSGKGWPTKEELQSYMLTQE